MKNKLEMKKLNKFYNLLLQLHLQNIFFPKMLSRSFLSN